MRFLKFDRKTAMQAAKVAGAVGAGAIAADVGGRLVRGMSTTAAGFAARSDLHMAATDLVGGVLVGGVALAALSFSKRMRPLAAKLTPFVLGGVVMRAVARPIGGKVAGAIDGVIARVMPASTVEKAGGLFANPAEGLAGELPAAGGLWGDPTQGLAGELPVAGGSNVIGGELV
jgi:hypothetical protein